MSKPQTERSSRTKPQAGRSGHSAHAESQAGRSSRTTTLIERPLYTDVMKRFLGTPEIKVLIGVRRCGKSSLLALLAAHLRDTGVEPNNIVHIGLDSYGVPLNPSAEWLDAEIASRLEASDAAQPSYILLDEVQEVPGWEKVVRRLATRDNTDIFITGSNSRVLSGDLATLLAGRYVEIAVHPLNFAEYEAFARENGWTGDGSGAGSGADRTSLLDDFLTYGGMPGLFHHPQGDEDAFRRLLSSITDTVVLKDVVERHNIKDTELLTRLIRYVFSTSGNLLSTKKIVDTLNSTGRKSSQETIDNYIKALVSSKILAPCPQAGTGGREILRQRRKYYVVDTGLRNMSIAFNRTRDVGFQFEGLVHNELACRGWTLNSLRDKNDGEVDFAASRFGEKMYVQVSCSVLDEMTFEREAAPLRVLDDSFPKFIVVKDRSRCGVCEDGIRIVNVLDWLDYLG